MKRVVRNKRAFTLIELLVVVLIVGILAAVAVPQYQVAMYKARLSSVWAMMKAIKQANQLYYLEHGEYTSDIDAWDIELPSGWTATHTADSTWREIVLPNGDHFQVVSASREGIADPRVQGWTSKCSARLWTAYAKEGYKCYPQGTDLGVRVCKALGCTGNVTKETNSCVLPY